MTNDALVQELVEDGYLKTPRIIEAFQAIDRKKFVPKDLESSAYVNEPLPIGYGQTISQPLTVAFMFELLDPHPGQNILDVGFGSGWTTALLAHIVGEEGKVYGIEIVPELYEFGKKNIEKFQAKQRELFSQSGYEGLPEHAPFDRILVSAAPPAVPEALKHQLVKGGRLVIPVGSRGLGFGQSLTLIRRVDEERFKEKEYPGFAFVPLIKE